MPLPLALSGLLGPPDAVPSPAGSKTKNPCSQKQEQGLDAALGSQGRRPGACERAQDFAAGGTQPEPEQLPVQSKNPCSQKQEQGLGFLDWARRSLHGYSGAAQAPTKMQGFAARQV